MANRPPKKTKRQLEAEKLQNQLDERNTVLVDDDDFSNAELEDKVWLYWNRNKASIIFTVVAMFGIVLGTQYYRYATEQSRIERQNAYLEADTPEEKAAFGAEHSSHALGGLALLEAADAEFTEGEYAAAAETYAKAAEALDGQILDGRARLGVAMSQILSGEKEAGMAQLETLSGSSEAPAAIRAESAFHLAVLYIEESQYEQALDLLQSIEAQGWQNRAQNLIAEVPELADLRQERASETTVTAEAE